MFSERSTWVSLTHASAIVARPPKLSNAPRRGLEGASNRQRYHQSFESKSPGAAPSCHSPDALRAPATVPGTRADVHFARAPSSWPGVLAAFGSVAHTSHVSRAVYRWLSMPWTRAISLTRELQCGLRN